MSTMGVSRMLAAAKRLAVLMFMCLRYFILRQLVKSALLNKICSEYRESPAMVIFQVLVPQYSFKLVRF